MPRPLKKRKTPEPGAVTVRRGAAESLVEVVEPDELRRRKEDAESERRRRLQGLDVRADHERLALRLGAPVTVPKYTGDLWWFVLDVNGIDRTITVRTLIFEQFREETFRFDLVHPYHMWGAEENELAYWRGRVEARAGSVPHKRNRRAA